MTTPEHVTKLLTYLGGTMYTILGRPNCKWCDKAKELLSSKGEEYKYIDVTSEVWVVSLMMRGGFTTVPLIFNKGSKPIGGYTDLETLFKEGPV